MQTPAELIAALDDIALSFDGIVLIVIFPDNQPPPAAICDNDDERLPKLAAAMDAGGQPIGFITFQCSGDRLLHVQPMRLTKGDRSFDKMLQAFVVNIGDVFGPTN